jgi:hypothetical protein
LLRERFAEETAALAPGLEGVCSVIARSKQDDFRLNIAATFAHDDAREFQPSVATLSNARCRQARDAGA